MRKVQDLTGLRFGRLTVIHMMPLKKYEAAKCLCRCDCGNEAVVRGSSLKSGAISSCGCYHREVAEKTGREKFTTHGHSKERLYGVWLAMRRRCNNPNTASYRYYGGRGIKVCQEWQNEYESFRKWAVSSGYDENAPRGKCTLDRIDVDGNYEPSNCRWVAQKEQTRNTRSNHIVEFHGEKMSIAELAERVGMPYGKIQPRITGLKWSAEKSVETPFRQHK